LIDYYTLHWSDVVGQCGMLLLVGTYWALQTDRLDSKGFTYSFLNLVVAVLLGINLYFKPVLANITLEIFWAAMSLWGIYKWWKHEKSRRTSRHG